ncbi:hypothetical protein EUA04_10380 [Mycolicibacterium obuense]|uniref:Peptide chain release factor 1 n=1 Tax=Mycolicibacterium obuense TaxID=1807 RepID=A0A4R5XB64_9MYCO|nr:hypothetical protein [Mycolicibacterium obuense]TDL10301.1 hypothetical protein EUA04_10380 [Mycolicibacterium obuense]
MNSDRLRGLAEAPGPFVSLYVEDAVDDRFSSARWTAIRRHLEDSGVTERTTGAVERALLNYRPGPRRRGHAIIAGAGGLLLDEPLVHPPSVTVLRVSDYPYVLPLFGVGAARPPYVVAAVDRLGADLTVHCGQHTAREVVHGEGFPVHKPASAGLNGYGDHQHSTEEAVRMNIRATVDRITELTDRSHAELIFMCGEVRSRSDVVSELPHRIATRVVALPACAGGGRVDEHEIAESIDQELDRRGNDAVDMVVARFRSERSRRCGLAVEGLPEICAALSDGAVDTLIIADLHSATVVTGDDRTVIASDASALSMFGEPARRVALADEALPFVAIATDASVVVCPEDFFSAVDGVAALLRYPHVATGDSSADSPARQSPAVPL